MSYVPVDPAYPHAEGSIVFIGTEADLPAPSGGVITLESGKIYKIMNAITLTNRLACTGSCSIEGTNSLSLGLTYNGSSPLLTVTGGLRLHNIQLVNTGGGKCIDLTATAFTITNITDSIISNGAADTFVGVAGALGLLMSGSLWAGTDGFSVSNAWISIVLSTVGWNGLSSPTATLLKINSDVTATIIELTQNQYITAAVGQTALNIDTAVLPTTLGLVATSVFNGPGIYIDAGGVNSTTIGWKFSGNASVKDSASIGSINITDNALVTTINTLDVWEEINATLPWNLGALAERFELDTDNRSLKYIGKETIRCNAYMDATVEGAANNKSYQIRMVRNGGEEASSLFPLDFRTTPVNASHMHEMELNTNDTMKLQIRNRTDTTNVTVSYTQISIWKIG